LTVTGFCQCSCQCRHHRGPSARPDPDQGEACVLRKHSSATGITTTHQGSTYKWTCIKRASREIGEKGTIQKKAADTLEEARKVLAREQVASQALFDAIEKEVRTAGRKGPEGLRAKYWAWKRMEEEVERSDGLVLTAEESLDEEVSDLVNPVFHPNNPVLEQYTDQDEALLNTAQALKQGLHHWSEWTKEREITSAEVTPTQKKRWETILRMATEWAGEEYPQRMTKKQAVEYKRHLLTRRTTKGTTPKQSSVAKELRDLSAFWNWARRHEWASTKIWEGLASGLEGSEIQPLPVREVVEAADHKAMARTDLIYMIQRFTGCRKQGVCGLRGKDIDLENGLIHFVEYREDGRVRKLKNGQEAHVPIHRKLRPLLEKAFPSLPEGAIWPNQYKPSEETWGDRYGDTFPDKYGFNSHDLRRIVETQMAEANVSPYFAFSITGHRVPGTSKVTQQYVRPTAEELREIVEKIH
jgi:integrase